MSTFWNFMNIWNHHEKCFQKRTNMPGIGKTSVNIWALHYKNDNIFCSTDSGEGGGEDVVT